MICIFSETQNIETILQSLRYPVELQFSSSSVYVLSHQDC